MTKKNQTVTEPEAEEQETYLTYTIHKLVIIAKDNAVINIDNLMSGKPKEDDPPPGSGNP